MYSYGLVCDTCLVMKLKVPPCFAEAYLGNYSLPTAKSQIHLTPTAAKNLLQQLTSCSYLNHLIL